MPGSSATRPTTPSNQLNDSTIAKNREFTAWRAAQQAGATLPSAARINQPPVVAASPDAYLMVLLGGDAGLRLGEIVALEWGDVDLHARRLTVERSDWCGHVTVPKGGRSRRLPMTQRLTSALKAFRHLRSERVLCLPDGTLITRDRVSMAIRGAQRVAGLHQAGVHVLRHTFCSHLAMKGAPARAIQELAGHADLCTTQRYMHSSPAATEDGIRLLDMRFDAQSRVENGDILDTRSTRTGSN